MWLQFLSGFNVGLVILLVRKYSWARKIDDGVFVLKNWYFTEFEVLSRKLDRDLKQRRVKIDLTWNCFFIGPHLYSDKPNLDCRLIII